MMVIYLHVKAKAAGLMLKTKNFKYLSCNLCQLNYYNITFS